LCELQDWACEKGIGLDRIGKMKWFVLCEMQNWGAVHLYRIEIGGLGGGGGQGGGLGAAAGGRWIGCGLGTTFSQIHHALLARKMQKVVCVQAAAQ
jgi:hypothetical protein